MKSRWTTRLLAVAVTVVWGLVAWRMLVPTRPVVSNRTPTLSAREYSASATETLRLNYPDPFLRNAPTAAPARQPLPRRQPPTPKKPRTPLRAEHLASFAAAGRELHILTLDGRTCELRPGDTAAGFRLRKADAESLYLEREGCIYGVKRCER